VVLKLDRGSQNAANLAQTVADCGAGALLGELDTPENRAYIGAVLEAMNAVAQGPFAAAWAAHYGRAVIDATTGEALGMLSHLLFASDCGQWLGDAIERAGVAVVLDATPEQWAVLLAAADSAGVLRPPTEGWPESVSVPLEGARLGRAVLRHSTEPWAKGTRDGYLDIADGRYEVIRLESGNGILSKAGKWGQLLRAPQPSPAAVAGFFRGSVSTADAHRIAAGLLHTGPLRAALWTEAGVEFAARHPHKLIEWDDTCRVAFGWKRPGSREGRDFEDVLRESRRDFDRELYAHLRQAANDEWHGRLFSRPGEESGPPPRAEFFRIGFDELAPDGTIRRIQFDPVGISTKLGGGGLNEAPPAWVPDLLSLPDNTTAGRYALAIILWCLDYWGTNVNKPECRIVAREPGAPGYAGGLTQGFIFDTVSRELIFRDRPPDPPERPAQLLCKGHEWGAPLRGEDGRPLRCPGDTKHAKRAAVYWDGAVALLLDRELIDSYTETPTRYAASEGREPWPVPDSADPKGKRYLPPLRFTTAGERRRAIDWRTEWYRQRVLFTPGARVLPGLLAKKRNRGAA
jgi:hypothetical protein